MAYDNTNKGTIAKNTRKTQDTHPDIAGSINVDGVDYWLNGWEKKNSKDGSKFYSLSVKPKEPKREAPRRQDNTGTNSSERGDDNFADDLDDEIPF